MNKTKWVTAAILACAIASCKKDDDNNNNSQTLNSTDQTFMTTASYGNNAEIDAGTTASGMGSLGAVRSFGTMMVTDHTMAQNDLKTVGTTVGMTSLPTTPDSAHIQMKMMLMTMSGRSFDSAYMHMQSVDHQTTINLFQNEINNGSHQSVKDYANAKLPTIQMHKRMADSILTANGF